MEKAQAEAEKYQKMYVEAMSVNDKRSAYAYLSLQIQYLMDAQNLLRKSIKAENEAD